ncbi:MAG: AbrB family transcriptional regulator [Rhizobiales bacterium]|nr:AbrB family transcriptional regulator [Hyphomicrobiales bacterium]
MIIPSTYYSLLSFLIAGIASFCVYNVIDLPFAQILIAFAPGGVEAMIAMALLLNIDPTFVAAHHIMRLFILIGLIPYFMWRAKHK